MIYKTIASFALLLIFLDACTKKDTKGDEKLAQTHCGSCHEFPKPELLDKNNWEKVLPKMALFLGITNKLAPGDSISPIEKNAIPTKPALSEDEWQRIKDYYISQAPYRLNFPLSSTTEPLSNLFKIKSSSAYSGRMPNVSCIKIDSASKSIFVCDEINREIWVLDKDGIPKNQFRNQSAVSDLQISKNNLLITYIGNVIDPSVSHHGSVALMDSDNEQKTETLLTNLYRPTQSLTVNLDENPDLELVTNEFGVLNGTLAIWKKKGTAFDKIILENSPGAIKTIPIDLDKDGKTDLVTLFGQGDERVVWYKNNGNLNFTPTTLLRFPPVYGSSSLELTDFNKDGLTDIIYTAGDNSDYSIELKPYHGVYIFENQGKNNFKQTFFYHINGAYKALARDFDNDGDIDIATIAFYVDYFEKTPKDFVFFENKGHELVARSFDIKAYGRWLVMDAGDVDGDGDLDIVLGNHPLGKTPGTLLKDWVNSKNALLLINQTKP